MPADNLVQFLRTNEQIEIIESVQAHKLIKINAFAGTGKTSTLQHITTHYGNKTFLYLAYNKSIQLDAVGKFSKNVEVKTIHSLAYRYIASNTKLDLKNIKNHTVKDFANLFNTSNSRGKEILDVFTNYCNSSVSEMNYDNYSKYIRDIIEQIEAKNLPVSFDYLLKKFQLLLTIGLATKSYDVVMLDEAQDSSNVTLDIFSKLNATHKILVGDKHQQIYSFRESANIMEILDGYELPLTQTFRFPKNIATIANLLLERYKNENLKIVSEKDEISLDEILKDESKTIGYISRGNAGLIHSMIELSANKIPYKTIRNPKEIFITIKDIGYFLNKSYESISTQGAFLKSLHSEDELLKYIRETKDKQLYSFYIIYTRDFLKNIQAVLDLEVEAVQYFSYGENFRHFLTTAHTSKGLEFDGIIVSNDFMDFPCVIYEMGYKTYEAFLSDKNKSGHKLLDEINLLYVAITRCKQAYTILSENLKYIIDEKWENNLNEQLRILELTGGCKWSF